jgi:hypothetical protein
MLNKPGIRIIIFSTLFLLLCSLFIIFFKFQPGWDFRNNLWAPSYLLLHQHSPYDINALFADSNSIWMPMIIGVFFPIGYLPLQQAYNLWIMINIYALLFLVYISNFDLKFSTLSFLVLLIYFVFFPSTMSVLVLGQISLLTCSILLLVIKFDHKLHPLIIGLLLALSLSKPQLAIFFIPAYMVSVYKESGFKKTIISFSYMMAGVVLTCTPVFILYPNWIPDFLINIRNNPSWLQPTLYTLIFRDLGQVGRILGTLFFLSGFCICLFLTMRLPKKIALLWSLALTTIFSPYIWSWDFVLLLPLFSFYFCSKMSLTRKVLLIAGYIICILVFISMKVQGNIMDAQNWWIPIFLIGVLLLGFVISFFEPRKTHH